MSVVISGTGLFTPKEYITNDELVESFNAYVDLYNQENEEAINSGDTNRGIFGAIDDVV